MGKLILSRGRLFELVWAKPMTELARQFGVRARHLARACDRHDIPRPEPGHWQKLVYGKPLRESHLAEGRFDADWLIEIDVEDQPLNNNHEHNRAA
jgi:hypothetical protein